MISGTWISLEAEVDSADEAAARHRVAADEFISVVEYVLDGYVGV